MEAETQLWMQRLRDEAFVRLAHLGEASGGTNQPLVTAGEPAGIGPELCNALADSPYADDLVVIGDRRSSTIDCA